MRKSKYSEEQIISFIKQAEAGMSLKELCRKHRFILEFAAQLNAVHSSDWRR